MSDHVVVLCERARRTSPHKDLLEQMPPCPICGRKAYLSHDVADGADYGYSGGCPAYCLNDGIHGISDRWDTKRPVVTGDSLKEVFDKWLAYCKRMEALKGEQNTLEEKE